MKLLKNDDFLFFILQPFQSLFFPFIKDFGNFTADPGKREKGEEDQYFVKGRMVRENDDIQHRQKKKDETD